MKFELELLVFLSFYVRDFSASMAYIGDLKIVTMSSGGHVQPDPGYHLIPVDLNKNAGGKYIYLTYKRTDDLNEAITSVSVIAGLTSSYPIQRGHKKLTQDICDGAGPKYIYITYIKGGQHGWPPLDGLDVIFGRTSHIYPPEHWVRDNQDCNDLAGGDYVYICYHMKREEVEEEG